MEYEWITHDGGGSFEARGERGRLLAEINDMQDREAALNIISLGAGVQSSVMALLAARGVIEPMPDYAIFADTQWEPKAVYAHLDWLETQLPFPVRRVTAGDLRQNTIDGVNITGHPFTQIPHFIRNKKGGWELVSEIVQLSIKFNLLSKKFGGYLG